MSGIVKVWNGSAYEELLLNTETHASTHATGGGDALTPADIGAATAAQGTDDRTASGLRTASTVVSVSAATAPSSGQVLTATGTTAATWQTPTGGDTPGGSATELQYRGGASTLSGADSTAWDATNKRLSLGAGASPASVLHIKPDSASEIVEIVQGTTSQTAALTEWRNVGGTVLASISATGVMSWSGLWTAATLTQIGYSNGWALSAGNWYWTGTAAADSGSIFALNATFGTQVVGASASLGFTSSAGGGNDIRLMRAAAGIVQLNNGSTGGASFELIEQTAPAAPGTNKARLFLEDNGSGKTRLMIQFATGAAQQIAIEP